MPDTHECHNLPAAARHLRMLADELDQMQATLSLPAEQYSIESAFAKLRTVLGAKQYISLTPPAFLSSGAGTISPQEWSIYLDSDRMYQGSTLAAVVNECIRATQPQAPATVAEVQDKLDGVAASEVPF